MHCQGLQAKSARWFVLDLSDRFCQPAPCVAPQLRLPRLLPLLVMQTGRQAASCEYLCCQQALLHQLAKFVEANACELGGVKVDRQLLPCAAAGRQEVAKEFVDPVAVRVRRV